MSEGSDSLLSVGVGVEGRLVRPTWSSKRVRDEVTSDTEDPGKDKGERREKRGNEEESRRRPNLRKSKRGREMKREATYEELI